MLSGLYIGFAGIGDGVSFGITRSYREAAGNQRHVDVNSLSYKIGNIVGAAELVYFSFVSVVATGGGSIEVLSPIISIQGVAANYVQDRPYAAVHGGVQAIGTRALAQLPGGIPVAGVMDVLYSVTSGIYDE